MRVAKLFLVVGLSLTNCQNLFAASAQSDFDEDGKSELTLITINDNNSLSWNSKSAQSGVAASHGNLGKSGDHVVMGNWNGLSLGIIKEDEDTGKVTWKVKDMNGVVKTLEFGTNKDLFVSGGDYDGDGRLDAAVVESKGKKLKWKIILHPFGDEGAAEVQEFTFGKKNEAAFFMDLEGTGDWIAVLGEDPKKSTKRIARIKNIVTGEVRKIKTGNPKSRPEPIADSTGIDNFAFINKGTNTTSIIIKDRSGKKISKTTIPAPGEDEGEVIIGDFTNEPGEEVAVQSSTGFVVFNPFTKGLTEISADDGIPVDEININSFQKAPGSGDSGDDGTIQPDNCGTLNLPDGGDGNLWKPNSDTQYYAVFVAHSQYTGKISQVRTYDASNNQFIKNLTYKGVGNGNRSNWQDYSLTGSNYKSQYGAIRIRVDLKSGSCVSAVVTDPSDRVD